MEISNIDTTKTTFCFWRSILASTGSMSSMLYPFHQRVELSVQCSVVVSSEHILVHALFASPLLLSCHVCTQTMNIHGAHPDYRHQSDTWLQWWLNERGASCGAILRWNVCRKVVRYCGNTNLYKHMKNHKKENSELQQKRREEEGNASDRWERDHWQSLFREERNIQVYSI